MTLNLSEVVFDNDFFEIDMADGSILTLNQINEDIFADGVEVKLNRINVQITKFDPDTNEATYVACPCVIGIHDDLLEIKTEYTEYEGDVLTSDNMKYCTIEVYE